MPDVCPKCGSDKVLNDQCLKCGIVISKYLNTTSSASPVSFVADQQHHKEFSYSINKDALLFDEQRKKLKTQSRLIGVVLIVLLGGIAYFLYDFFIHRASAYKGLYKNHEMIYGLHLPEKAGDWYHAKSDLHEELGLHESRDWFYRGDEDTPDIIIAVYSGGHAPVPERMSSAQRERLLDEAEKEVLQLMESANVDCEIIDSTSRKVGERDGFVLETELNKNGKTYRAFIIKAYYIGLAYTVYVAGPDERITEMNEDVQSLIRSFSFKTSVI